MKQWGKFCLGFPAVETCITESPLDRHQHYQQQTARPCVPVPGYKRVNCICLKSGRKVAKNNQQSYRQYFKASKKCCHKEGPKKPDGPCRYSMCPEGTVPCWTVISFYYSGCINSNGWWEGNLSRLYHVCDIIKPHLKPTLEAVSGPEWCKCLELLPPAKV